MNLIVKDLLSPHSYIDVALVTKILADACLHFINFFCSDSKIHANIFGAAQKPH